MRAVGTGVRVRTAIIAVTMALIVVGCGWPQARSDAGNSASNRFARGLSAATVASLTPAYTLVTNSGQGADVGVYASVVADLQTLYTGSGTALRALDLGGVRGCGGIPRTCAPLWRGTTTGPALLADGVVFALPAAYDAAGVRGCGGTPKVCSPLWTMSGLDIALRNTGDFVGTYPVVAYGRLWAISLDNTSGTLTAVVNSYDTRGVQGCGGIPKVCAPMASYPFRPLAGSTTGIQGPVVAGGLVYAAVGEPGTTTLAAMSTATGQVVWRSQYATGSIGQLMAADGKVFAFGARNGVSRWFTFDGAGVQGCSGTPKLCAPLWQTDGVSLRSRGAVANGMLYALGIATGEVAAFDENGNIGCSGAPRLCQPRWTSVGGGIDLVVANDVVFTTDDCCQLSAFDAKGTAGCTGSPVRCQPLLRATTTDAPLAPIISNGKLVVPSASGRFTVYTLPG